mmetsp:Transcript_68247/g.107233  ORF Transcript_68247/g.107233 Transcript_68247/m.107233 type:complete len:344 (+) Transcript_68247:456-1487(+)
MTQISRLVHFHGPCPGDQLWSGLIARIAGIVPVHVQGEVPGSEGHGQRMRPCSIQSLEMNQAFLQGTRMTRRWAEEEQHRGVAFASRCNLQLQPTAAETLILILCLNHVHRVVQLLPRIREGIVRQTKAERIQNPFVLHKSVASSRVACARREAIVIHGHVLQVLIASKLSWIAHPEDSCQIGKVLHTRDVQSTATNQHQDNRQIPGSCSANQLFLSLGKGDVWSIATFSLQAASFAQLRILGPKVRILYLWVIAREASNDDHSIGIRSGGHGRCATEFHVVARRQYSSHLSQAVERCHHVNWPSLVVAQQLFRGIPQRSINCQSQIALQRQPSIVLQQDSAL